MDRLPEDDELDKFLDDEELKKFLEYEYVKEADEMVAALFQRKMMRNMSRRTKRFRLHTKSW